MELPSAESSVSSSLRIVMRTSPAPRLVQNGCVLVAMTPPSKEKPMRATKPFRNRVC